MTKTLSLSTVAAALALVAATTAQAEIKITEVMPSGSGNSPYAHDWFELTNFGASAVTITGWKMDDNSHTPATLARALRGITTIAPGESVIFGEGLADGSTDATLAASFKSHWFGASVPAGFQIGYYGGSGVGLGTGGDEVNIYTSSDALVTSVIFGAATVDVSFDNAAGLFGTVTPITAVSAEGVNGGFKSFVQSPADALEVGSPGTIVNAVTVPSITLSNGVVAGFDNVGEGGQVDLVVDATTIIESEIDALTANTAKGAAVLSPVPPSGMSKVYVMLWLDDTTPGTGDSIDGLVDALDLAGATISDNDGDADDAALQAKWDELQAVQYAGFNVLVEFSSPGAFDRVNWDFADFSDIVVDQIAVVPEPTSLGLLALGGLALLGRRRKA